MTMVNLDIFQQDKEVFMKSEFDTENIAQFLEGMLQSEESKMSEEERKKDYTPSPPPDIEVETDKEGLYIDHEASKCLLIRRDIVLVLSVWNHISVPIGHI